MFTNWIPGIPKQNITKSSTNTSNPSVDPSIIMKQILIKIEERLDAELGEKVGNQVEEIMNSVAKQQTLEQALIETKSRYHELVTKLDSQTEALKDMLAQIVNFMTTLCETLQNTDMLTPIKDFENGFLNCNVSKVEKQLKYFSKLYEAALTDYLKIRLQSKTEECREQVNLYKNLNKNLESELVKLRNDKGESERKMLDLTTKNAELNQKMGVLEKAGVENLMKASVKDKERAKVKEDELLQKIRALEKEKAKIEKAKKEADSQVIKANSAIQIIRDSQQAIIEEMRSQIQKKQLMFSQKLANSSHQKLNMEEKLKFAESEIENLREQLTLLKIQDNQLKKKQSNHEAKELQQRIKDLEGQKQALKRQMQSLVSKDIIKTLFVGYEDQSKQWTIRRDIRNQIYGLLGARVQKEEKSEDGKKWFGWF